MTLETRSREQLVEALTALLAQQDASAKGQQNSDRLLHELQVHQVELELQNRDLREAQSALEESRNRYADLYDYAPSAYYTFDRQGCILAVNLTGATMVGLERAGLLGKPFLALVKMEQPETFFVHLRHCAETGAQVTSELHWWTKSTGALDVQATTAPLLDPTGQLVGFRTVFADITLRKQAEAEREQALLSEQRLRRQIESLDGAVREIVATLATISTGSARSILQEITDQARLLAEAEYAACGIAGDVEAPFAPWVVSGMEPGRVAEMGRPPRAIGLLGLVVHEGRTVRVKDLRQHPAFRGFPADHPVMSSFLGVPIRYRGKSLGTLYLANKRGAAEFSEQDEQTIQELAERAAAAMEVARLSHGMQEAIASRENLLAVVSHDLRSPLSSLKYNIDLLILKSGSEDKWGIRQQLDLMIRSTAQMNRLICDLLNAAAVDSGTFTVDAQAEAVMPLVTGLVADIQSAVEDKGLQLTPTIARDLPAVWCDRLRIVQVLLNLVGNALKFTSRGGRISITVELLEKEVCFQVADTGSGIADEDKAHLFERYWKGKPSGTHGTGLGLYIAKGIVQAHGGRLWVESEVGVGTTFLFTLPLADERAAATLPGPAAVRLVPASAPPAAAGDPVPPRILLVDDDQNALSALTMLLAEEGFVVEAAASGLEALPKLYTLAPDVLVVDIEMPGLRGPELVAKARELHPDLPVIVLSGHRREHSTIVTLQKETRARYLSKPVDLDELIQAIRELGAKG